MLRAIVNFIGFGKVASRSTSKRPRSARKKASVATTPGPDLALRQAERRRYEEDQIARAERTIRTVGAAAHIYARSVGQVGERPPATHLARAVEVLGLDIYAYFRALVLAGRPVPLVPLSLVGDPGREKGFARGLKDDLEDDLDLWASVPGLEAKVAKLAMRTNQPIPTPIVIPEVVKQRLLERDRLRANRAGGSTGKGGMRAETVAPIDPTPPQEPETGSRGVNAVKAPDEEEENLESPPPVTEDAAKPSSDDDDDPKGPGTP